MRLPYFLFMLFAFAAANHNAHHHEEDSNNETSLFVELDDFKYVLKWCADYDAQAVTFEINIDPVHHKMNPRWLMIGFSDHGKLPGSDYCLYDSSTQKMTDGYLNYNLDHQVDIKQDCHLIENHYYPHGRLVFKRNFTTCDIRDYAFEPGTTQFLLASGPGSFKTLNDPKAAYHFRYNMVLQYPVKFPPIGSEVKTFEIRAKNAPVPVERTTYWCAITKLEANIEDQKHHVIKIEPIITPGMEQIVHHMVVFHCFHPDDATEYNGLCQSEESAIMSHLCSKTIAAWSMGASAVLYPKEAGLPIGGHGFRPYVMVEIHYNNPQLIPGKIDNSGIRFTYTPKLRDHDAGIIELGHIYSDASSIPPRQPAFPLTSYCVADCTNKFPKEGITIFGTQLHAHETGRKLWTSHFRKGIKIGEVNRDNHYTHHWQHVMALQKPVHVLPGDVLETTCVYDTSDKPEFVFGGYEINNEMCVNYIYYYPVSEVEVCKSAVDNSTLRAWFQKHGVDPGNKTFFNEKYQQLEANWDEEMTKDLLELYTSGKINMACLQHDGKLFDGHPTKWENVDIPTKFAGVFEKKRAFDECLAIND